MSDAPDEETVSFQLDADFREWAEQLPENQRAALVRWQRADVRFYRRIQNLLRSGVDDPEADEVAELLLDAIAAGRLARDITAWRGLRNVSALFGVDVAGLSSLIGHEIRADGLLAVSIARSVAVGEFTRPPSADGAGLVRARIPRGTPAAWVKLVGAAEMEYQQELLLSDGHHLRVLDVAYTGDLPIVDVEVS